MNGLKIEEYKKYVEKRLYMYMKLVFSLWLKKHKIEQQKLEICVINGIESF